jgi:hypothetical protein
MIRFIPDGVTEVSFFKLTDRDTVDFGEGDAYQVPSEDFPITRFDYFVEVQTAADRALVQAGKRSQVYTLRHPFRCKCDVEQMVQIVKARGVINLDHWDVRETWPLEEKWAVMAEHEWEVGHGYRAEHDLYHGVP